jgi:hypothetical protein
MGYTLLGGSTGAAERLTGDLLTTGEVVPEVRDLTSSAIPYPASGGLHVTYFTAARSEPINTVTMWTGSVAAGATPTLCRYGVYAMAANGDLTLIGSTPNDTAMFAATNTAYPKALSATWNKVGGMRYAVGQLVVTAAALPNFHGKQLASTNIINALVRTHPYTIGRLTSQTDLPANITAGSMIGNQGLMAFQLS